MSKWLNRILCPIDLDADCTDELRLAATLGTENNAAVCLLYVAAEPVARGSEPVPDWQQKLQSKLDALGSNWLDGKTAYDTAIWSGDPAAAIMLAAQDTKADVILMTTRCKGLDRLILGSVAERVVRESPVPVMTIKPKQV